MRFRKIKYQIVTKVKKNKKRHQNVFHTFLAAILNS